MASGIGKVDMIPLRDHHPLVTMDRPLMTLNRFRDPSKLHRKFALRANGVCIADDLLLMSFDISRGFPEFLLSTFGCLRWTPGHLIPVGKVRAAGYHFESQLKERFNNALRRSENSGKFMVPFTVGALRAWTNNEFVSPRPILHGMWTFSPSSLEQDFAYVQSVSDIALLQRSVAVIERSGLKNQADQMLSRIAQQRTKLEKRLTTFRDDDGQVAALSDTTLRVDVDPQELAQQLIQGLNDVPKVNVEKAEEMLEQLNDQDEVLAESMVNQPQTPTEALMGLELDNAMAAVVSTADYEAEFPALGNPVQEARPISEVQANLMELSRTPAVDPNVDIFNQSLAKRVGEKRNRKNRSKILPHMEGSSSSCSEQSHDSLAGLGATGGYQSQARNKV